MIFIELKDLFECDGYCSTETVGGASRLIRRDLTCSLHSGSTERLVIWKAGRPVVSVNCFEDFPPLPRIVDA